MRESRTSNKKDIFAAHILHTCINFSAAPCVKTTCWKVVNKEIKAV